MQCVRNDIRAGYTMKFCLYTVLRDLAIILR